MKQHLLWLNENDRIERSDFMLSNAVAILCVLMFAKMLWCNVLRYITIINFIWIMRHIWKMLAHASIFNVLCMFLQLISSVNNWRGSEIEELNVFTSHSTWVMLVFRKCVGVIIKDYIRDSGCCCRAFIHCIEWVALVNFCWFS